MLLESVNSKYNSVNQSRIRKIHRWLGTIAVVQLLIWTVSGLFFAVIPIDDIRGSQLIESPATFRLGHVKLVSPSSLVSRYSELSTVRVDQIQIKQRLNTPIYLVKVAGNWAVFNAESAEKMKPLTEAEAYSIASNSSPFAVRSATWITSLEPGSEYRDGELPAWKIELKGPDNANLWIGAHSGQVNAVRTTNWRIYDFMWSLHIMDYTGRDNFNSWLLRGFALLGVITVLSGIVLIIHSLRRNRQS